MYYRRAQVHVLPSLRESPGLVTLEAAMYETNCVVSSHGPITEYFGQDVWCCEPIDIHSIQTAILSAWNAPINNNLKEKIQKRFTWKEAARVTLDAYKNVLFSNKRHQQS
jgi:glycosyltransferase involved in cell wall biosynthesis